MALCLGLPRSAGKRKVNRPGFYWRKRQWHQLHMQVCTSLQTRGVQGAGNDMNPVESAGVGMNAAGIPQGWIWQLQDSREDGFYYGRNPALRQWYDTLTSIDTYESVKYAFNFCLVSLAPVKSRLFLPFWYRLTQVVLEKRPLKVVVVVVVHKIN